MRIGAGTFLNLGVMVAAQELVEIGDHCMLANGCFVSDASHRYDDPQKPITWQGFESKGPTRIGDNCWLGANVVVTSGVSIGERCVIGANSVVTSDIEPFSVAAGAPGAGHPAYGAPLGSAGRGQARRSPFADRTRGSERTLGVDSHRCQLPGAADSACRASCSLAAGRGGSGRPRSTRKWRGYLRPSASAVDLARPGRT